MSQGPRETATFKTMKIKIKVVVVTKKNKSGGDDKKLWVLGRLEDLPVQIPVVRTTTI